MAVRSKRLFGPTNINTASQSVYTVPAGETTLVKSVVAYNSDVVTRTVVLGVANAGVGTHFVFTLAAGAVERVECWLALPAGVSLFAGHRGTVGIFRLSAYGAELEGAAD